MLLDNLFSTQHDSFVVLDASWRYAGQLCVV